MLQRMFGKKKAESKSDFEIVDEGEDEEGECNRPFPSLPSLPSLPFPSLPFLPSFLPFPSLPFPSPSLPFISLHFTSLPFTSLYSLHSHSYPLLTLIHFTLHPCNMVCMILDSQVDFLRIHLTRLIAYAESSDVNLQQRWQKIANEAVKSVRQLQVVKFGD